MTHKEAVAELQRMLDKLVINYNSKTYGAEIEALQHGIRVIEYRLYRNHKNGKVKKNKNT